MMDRKVPLPLLCLLVAMTLVPQIATARRKGKASTEVIEFHSFKSPFAGPDNKIPHWEYGNDASASDDFVRLTQAAQSQQGYLWNVEPVGMEGWEVTFSFKVTGPSSPGADGFAFWYVDEPAAEGDAFGMQDQFVGLSLFFDTYDNDEKNNNPYVLAMVNDGTLKYEHENDGMDHKLAGCIADFRNRQKPSVARITYEKNTLLVELDVRGRNRFERCLKVKDIYLPPHYYFGLTAATGHYADMHDIYEFSVVSLDEDYDPESHTSYEEGEAPEAEAEGYQEYDYNSDEQADVGEGGEGETEEELDPEMEEYVEGAVHRFLEEMPQEYFENEPVAHQDLVEVDQDTWDKIQELSADLWHQQRQVISVVENEQKAIKSMVESLHYKTTHAAVSKKAVDTVKTEVSKFQKNAFVQLNGTLDRSSTALDFMQRTLNKVSSRIDSIDTESLRLKISSLDQLLDKDKSIAALKDLKKDASEWWEELRSHKEDGGFGGEASRASKYVQGLKNTLKNLQDTQTKLDNYITKSLSDMRVELREQTGFGGYLWWIMLLQAVIALSYAFWKRGKTEKNILLFPSR